LYNHKYNVGLQVRMRTEIEVDDELIDEALSLTGITTTQEVVDTALRMLVEQRRAQALLALEGKIAWEGDLSEMRRARYVDGTKRDDRDSAS